MNTPSRNYIDAKGEDGLFWDQHSGAPWKKARTAVISSENLPGFRGERDPSTSCTLL